MKVDPDDRCSCCCRGLLIDDEQPVGYPESSVTHSRQLATCDHVDVWRVCSFCGASWVRHRLEW